MSTQSAHRTIHDLLDKPTTRSTRSSPPRCRRSNIDGRNPRELVIETILEGYRHEHRILAEAHIARCRRRHVHRTLQRAAGGRQARPRRRRRRPPRLSRPDDGQRGRPALGSRRFRRALLRRCRHRRHRHARQRIHNRPFWQGGRMWDFETDPSTRSCWTGRTHSCARRSNRSTSSGRTAVHPLTETRRKVVDPLKEQVRREGPVGDASRPRARRPRLRPAEAGAAQRDPRPVAVGADHLRLSGTRHRQRRDHRPLRHPRAEGALPAPAARRRAVLRATR